MDKDGYEVILSSFLKQFFKIKKEFPTNMTMIVKISPPQNKASAMGIAILKNAAKSIFSPIIKIRFKNIYVL